MAVKIIHRGKAPDRHLKGKCYKCSTVIEALPEDCKFHPNADMRDPRERDYYDVACPECGYSIIMEPKNK